MAEIAPLNAKQLLKRIKSNPVSILKDKKILETIAATDPLDRDPLIKCLIAAAKPKGYTAKTVRQLIKDNTPTPKEESSKPKESMTDIMVRLANETGASFWHNPDQETYITYPVDNHEENHPIRSKVVKLWLGSLLRMSIGKTPGSQSLQDAMTSLEGMAMDGREYETYIRVGPYEKDNKVYVDLGDNTWRAVEVSGEGWMIIDKPPIKFKRTKSTRPLPEPTKGGNWDDLRSIINAKEEKTWILTIAWLVQAFWPKGPYEFLNLNGEPGSGKTFMQVILKSSMDPSSTNLRRPPREERDLAIAASNEQVLSLDNLSGMPEHLADSFCCLSTGGTFAVRSLYTDGEEALFSARRPCIMNGIDTLTYRSDLLDRTIVLDLPLISKKNRKKEETLLAQFNLIKPGIFGLLLDATSMGIRRESNGEVKDREEGMPRMIDFCRWVMACETALPWKPGEFMDEYTKSLKDSLIDLAEGDQIARAVLKLNSDFSGTATELLDKLNWNSNIDPSHPPKGWPNTSNYLSSRLRRAAATLRANGVIIEWTTNPKHISITIPLDPKKDKIDWEGPFSTYWGKDLDGFTQPTPESLEKTPEKAEQNPAIAHKVPPSKEEKLQLLHKEAKTARADIENRKQWENTPIKIGTTA
jgi:hypothetical protein